MIKELLFKMAKSPAMGGFVGGRFRHCSGLIPVKKVYESREAIAFRHPKPSYENHLIISLKKPIRNLRELAMPENGEYLAEIRRAVESIRETYPEFGGEFTLVANGGKRQEVRQGACSHVHRPQSC